MATSESYPQELIWAKKAGGTLTDVGTNIRVDADGYVYLAGYASGNSLNKPIFGEGETNETILDAEGNDVIAAKYNPDGTLVWAVKAGGPQIDQVRDMTIDAKGNIYITGLFNGQAVFGSGESNETTLVSNGSNDVFVAKYNNSGLLQWAASGGGNSSDIGTNISVDSDGNVYVIGQFSTTATFDNTILTSNGGIDIFLAKYDNTGNLINISS